MKAKKIRKFYFINPYLFSLLSFSIILVVLVTSYVISICFDVEPGNFMGFLEDQWDILLCILAGPVAIFIVCIVKSYEFWGYVSITETGVTCYAPFKKKLIFDYSEINDIGIDYCWLSVNKQFFIYLSKQKIDSKYWHKINTLPISQNALRIQFTKDVFDSLLEQLPDKLRKTLYRSKTNELD